MNPVNKNNSTSTFGKNLNFLNESNQAGASRNFDNNSSFNRNNQAQQYTNQNQTPNQKHYGKTNPTTKTLGMMPLPGNRYQPYSAKSTTTATMNNTLNQSFASPAQSVANVGNKNENLGMVSNVSNYVVEEKEVNNRKTVRFLTGNIEKVIKWNKLLEGSFVHYEVIGRLYSIQEGTIRLQKVFLLRDVTGPVLKVVHFATDRINLPDFCLGITIRCVGRMIGPNTLQAVCIREATADEISTLPRIYYVCDQEVSKICLYK